MNIHCARRDLVRVLRTLQHAVDLHSTLLLRGHILLWAEAGSIVLTATNLQMGMVCRLEGAVESEGNACVPLHPLLAYLQTGSDDEQGSDDRLVLETRDLSLAEAACPVLLVNGEMALACLQETVFPPVVFPEPSLLRIRFAAARFKALCRRASCAMANAAAEPLLSCLWLAIQGRSLTLATTDLSCCAVQRLTCSGKESSLNELFFVPARPLSLLARLLPNTGEVDLLIDTRKSLLCLRTAQTDFLLRLVDGQVVGSEATHNLLVPLQRQQNSFLFEYLIPARFSTLVQVCPQALHSVLNRQRWPLVWTVESSQDGMATLSLRVYRPDATVTHHLPVQVWGPAIGPVWIEMGLLAQALGGAMGARHLILAFGNPCGPVVLRWLKPGDEGVDADYSYVFQPLDRLTLSCVPQMRRQVPEAACQWIEEQVDQARQRQEGQTFLHIRRDVLYRIACLVHFALLPTEEEIQQGVGEVKKLAGQSDYSKREFCVRSHEPLTNALALAAFAPGGSCLELSPQDHPIRLAFDASMVQKVLS